MTVVENDKEGEDFYRTVNVDYTNEKWEQFPEDVKTFGTMLVHRIAGQPITPHSFYLEGQILLYDLRNGTNSNTGEPIEQHTLVKSVPEVYIVLELLIPAIASAIDSEFGEGVGYYRNLNFQERRA